MARFTKWNNPNRKRTHRRISRADADLMAVRAMLNDVNVGKKMSVQYYDSMSDAICGMSSRNIYNKEV